MKEFSVKTDVSPQSVDPVNKYLDLQHVQELSRIPKILWLCSFESINGQKIPFDLRKHLKSDFRTLA